MTASRPLEGIRVVELGSSIAAPYATWVLAMMGADVIKVERPDGGDDARQWGPPSAMAGMRAFFVMLNSNKKSATIDMTDAKQRAKLRRHLVEKADIVVQNMRPGLVSKYGISAEELRAENPRLIYVNCGAFGATGPYKDRPGYDPLMQAFGGIMSVTGEDGRPPVRVGTSLIDMGTGMWCAMGAITALYRRALDGKGCTIDASLYETAVGWMSYQSASYFGTGKDPKRVGSRSPGMAPYQAYECADGYLVIASPNNRLFAKLCEVVGHPEWVEDPRFASNPLRWENLDALNAVLEPIVRTGTRAHWQAKLDAVGVPSGPIQSISEMIAHPQTQALGIVEETEDRLLQLIGLPFSLDGTRPPITTSPPPLGAHTNEILGD